MKKLIVLALLSTSCTPLFFGGKVVGPYFKHFKGKMECAYVEAIGVGRVCLCHITADTFGKDKSFLVADDVMCEQSFDM